MDNVLYGHYYDNHPPPKGAVSSYNKGQFDVIWLSNKIIAFVSVLDKTIIRF